MCVCVCVCIYYICTECIYIYVTYLCIYLHSVSSKLVIWIYLNQTVHEQMQYVLRTALEETV